MKDWCGQAVQVTIPAVGTGTQRAAEGGGRAEQGCAPGSRELPHWLRHFVRAVGDCWELIHCDWVSWDVTGCWALAYIFKNWMPWKVLRFLLLCTSDLSIQRGSLCLRLTLVCKTGTVSSSLHKREQGKYGLPFFVLRQKPNNSHLFSHCATEPFFSNGLVANFSESSAKGTYLVMGFSYVF